MRVQRDPDMMNKIISLKKSPSKFVAFTAIFAVLFALGNFIAIPTVASIEMVVTFICATLFGPQIAILSSLVGELIVMPIAPPSEVLFIYSVFIGDAIAALIMGYGRNLAFVLEPRFKDNERKARITGESIAYILMLLARYTFYTAFDAILLFSGILISDEGAMPAFITYTVGNYTRFVFKAVFLPLCIIITETIRKNLRTNYFDIARIAGSTS